ncbi:DUF4925 domain-containing protein [Parabacteroides goldsteinii]|mgnify:FL=1|uniref:DUF4925 domain-containing protein n=1 Tax=Parabacteroides goldsteinii TaxID=328812 RepID=UPI002166B017|nr:DUF4925 domain-containing protein [Parabacteroides goldsteinii]MCS2425496.1 DUF4925 domain-containing protein [Parabacteroides goldsteinii]
MKKNLLYLFTVLCMLSFFTACSDDDDVKCPVENTVFTDNNGLQLTYSGEALLGKEVSFTSQGVDKAVLTLSGASLNLLDLIPAGKSTNNTSTEGIATAGVVPGELTTTLNVDLLVEGEKVSFEGTDEKDGRVINYKGEATKDGLKLDLQVTMPKNNLAGTSWQLAPAGIMSADPIHIVWDADEFPFNGNGTWDIQSALLLTMGMAQIKDGMTVPQLLFGILNEVTFLPDGNIQAKYKNTPADTEWKESPLNLAMYAVKGDKLHVYLNANQIMAVASKSRAIDLSFVTGLLKNIVPMLAEGVPLSYTTGEDGKTVVYLGKDVLLPLLQQIAPLFEDEQTVNSLVELLKESAGEELAGLVELFLKPVLVAMPDIIATTTDVQIGLTLLPVTE